MKPKTPSRLGRPSTTSCEEILAAANELLLEGGESELSFRKLAAKLHISAPGIYTYFSSKQALLLALVEGLLHFDMAIVSNQTPVEKLHSLLSQLRQRLLQHQHLMFLFSRAIPAASMMQVVEQIASIIEPTGIERGKALRHGQSLLWMALGFVIFEAGSQDEQVIALFSGMSQYEESLAHLDLQQHDRLWQETLARNLLFLT